MTAEAARPGEARMPHFEARHGAVFKWRMALNKPTFRERKHLVAGHDEMVDHPDVY